MEMSSFTLQKKSLNGAWRYICALTDLREGPDITSTGIIQE